MESGHQSFSIAIIGSGIGGLALAIGLLKQNVQCTIYEAAQKFDAVGAGIGLGPNALRSMQMMDEKFAKMYDEVKVGNTSPLRVHEQFEVLGAEEGLGVESGWHGGSVSHPDFTRSSAHRKALLDIMKSLIPDGVVQFNKRVLSIDQVPGKKVILRFTDGQVSEVDAVIGCDGIKGMTRRVVLESRYPEEIPAKYANTYVYRGIAPMDEARKILGSYAEDAKWYMMERKGWAMYPISSGTEVNMVAFMHDQKPWVGEQVAREVSKEQMESEFVGMDDRLKAMLKVFDFPLFDIVDIN
jgi:salicylate hydroxylase